MSEGKAGNHHHHIPVATYRLQFNEDFTFRQAASILDYLNDLGISDCYASPLLTARPGSRHGYDVIDHSRLNPELGGGEGFEDFASGLRPRRLGLIMDVVPNHMCIAGSGNRWWNDVLENGPSSPYAGYFDIDWEPPKPDLKETVLLPVLGDQYGRVIENREIAVRYRDGAFFADYYDTRLPIAPRTYLHILEPLSESLRLQRGEEDEFVRELESIMTALRHLPGRDETDPEKIRERQREKEIIKSRLHRLIENCVEAGPALEHQLIEINGIKDDPSSFDRLVRLLDDQAYRLSYWRVASDEINYRRFFDINELAAIRVEQPEVFETVHELILKLAGEGIVTGLRIDHVDGLYDPLRYLTDLQAATIGVPQPAGGGTSASIAVRARRPLYVVVEKILSHGETMRSEWPVRGTTGYGFLNLLNGVFVETTNESGILQIYERITGNLDRFEDIAYQCKKLILRVAMSSELHVLARRLDRVSERSRYTRDFTLNSLQYALGEVIACFPVYRSYTRRQDAGVSHEDRLHTLKAISEAKRRNPAISPSIFDFIESLLLLSEIETFSESDREERLDFIMRFQQLTSPVMAKGVEDTAFYRFYPLSSLNEVGGEPGRFGVSLDDFHRHNFRRLVERPHSMSTTSTHDTKRGEDVRARINSLSEVPGKWYRAIRTWRALNQNVKPRIGDAAVPDANEEYLLYQTLIGTWPLTPLNRTTRPEYIGRIRDYLIKAMREAKVHTSWINPNEAYERAAEEFIEGILTPGPSNRFLRTFLKFQAMIARSGIYNSLAQTLIKITAPGVPDIYQGTELWAFDLVDPDNRRPVDYPQRIETLSALQRRAKNDPAELLKELIAHPQDGAIKLHLLNRSLHFRRHNRELFTEGDYLPMEARGEKEYHVIGFSRRQNGKTAIVLAGRFFTRLGDLRQPPAGREVWGDTHLPLDGYALRGRFRDVLSGKSFESVKIDGRDALPLGEVFGILPMALLEPEG
ncbi:MAG: malto-oligosyltrehalose synthase [Acidobacteriota bacterium]|nr:MAG: malto-oligosyltrehalose synthase [Acidobacteriota bacterium]